MELDLERILKRIKNERICLLPNNDVLVDDDMKIIFGDDYVTVIEYDVYHDLIHILRGEIKDRICDELNKRISTIIEKIKKLNLNKDVITIRRFEKFWAEFKVDGLMISIFFPCKFCENDKCSTCKECKMFYEVTFILVEDDVGNVVEMVPDFLVELNKDLYDLVLMIVNEIMKIDTR